MAYYGSEDESVYSDEDLVAVEEHVTPDMFSHVQKIPIDIEVTASAIDLERNPQLCIWKMQQQLTKHFKQNLATVDRMNAGEDELRGNVDRILPLGFDIEMQANTFPFAMGADIPGLMRNNIHRDGVCTYRLPPLLAAESCSKSIFDAENIVSADAYENYRLCTLEELQNDIEFKPKRQNADAHARVAVGSLAYKSLVKNLNEGHWRGELSRQQVDSIFNPDAFTVHVTEKMGNDIKNQLQPHIEQIAKSFIDISNFNIKIHRADGEKSFTSPKKIAGAINQTAGGKNTSTKMNMDALGRNCTYYVKGVLSFVTF